VCQVLKVADFGVAYAASTSKGTQMRRGGTECYKSPEQAWSNLCGTKADMWALGCMLVEVLQGQRLQAPLWNDKPEVKAATANQHDSCLHASQA
jgi:serine/threonine protein kinase